MVPMELVGHVFAYSSVPGAMVVEDLIVTNGPAVGVTLWVPLYQSKTKKSIS